MALRWLWVACSPSCHIGVLTRCASMVHVVSRSFSCVWCISWFELPFLGVLDRRAAPPGKQEEPQRQTTSLEKNECKRPQKSPHCGVAPNASFPGTIDMGLLAGFVHDSYFVRRQAVEAK